jgi:hypothetical protein
MKPLRSKWIMFAAAMLFAVAAVSALDMRDYHVSTLSASCITELLGYSSNSPTLFMSLREFVDCARTAPMDAPIGYQLAKYAIYSRELHSLRQWQPPGVKSRFEGLLDLFSSPTSFTPAAAGISELDFLRILVNAFDSGYDLHFQFKSENILGTSRVPRPIVLGSRYNGSTGEQELFVDSLSAVTDIMEGWFGTQSRYSVMPNSLGFSFTKFRQNVTGAASRKATVVKINGIPAMDWATKVMRNSFPLDDDGAAFNWGLEENFVASVLNQPPSLMDPSLTPGAPSPWNRFHTKYASPMVIDGNSLYRDVYELDDGSKIVAPVVVEVRNTARPHTQCSGMADPVDTAAAVGGVSGRAVRDPVVAMAQRTVERAEDDYRSVVRDKKRRLDGAYVSVSEEGSFARHRVYGSPLVNVYLVPRPNASKVLYFRVFGFAMGASYADDQTSLTEAIDAAVSVTTDNMTTMVFDVFGNGGGYVALEEIFMAAINFSAFGPLGEVVSTVTPKGRVETYMRVQNRTSKAYRTDISSKTTFGVAAGSFVNSNLAAAEYGREIGSKFVDSMMNVTQDATTGNRTYSYTTITSLTNRFWYDAQGPAGSDYLTNLFENIQFIFSRPLDLSPWRKMRNITIISNGFCASACSMFTSRLLQLPAEYRVKTFTFGGVTAVAGGAVEMSQTCGGSVRRMSCPGDAIRQVPAGDADFKFPGRPDFALVDTSLDNYYPAEITYNEYHWYTHRSDAVPRQYQAAPGANKIKIWQPNLEQRFSEVFSYTPPASSASQAFSFGAAFFLIVVIFLP